MFLRPLTFSAAMGVDSDAVLVGSHHSLDIILFEDLGEVTAKQTINDYRSGDKSMATGSPDIEGCNRNFRFCQLVYLPVGERSILEDPGSGSGKGVAAVDDVPVLRKAAEHVFETLLQGVELRLD